MRRFDCSSCLWLSALQRKIRTHFAIPTQHRAPEHTVKPLVIFCVSRAEEASRRQSGLGRRNCLELPTLPAASEPRSTAMPDGPACWATQRQLTEQPSLFLAFRPLTCSLARLAGRRGASVTLNFPADSSPVGLHGTQKSYSCGFCFPTWKQSGTNNQSPAGAAWLAPPLRPILTPLPTPPLLWRLAGF